MGLKKTECWGCPMGGEGTDDRMETLHPTSVTCRIWSVKFKQYSTKKSRRSTKIGRKVVRTTGDIAHQF